MVLKTIFGIGLLNLFFISPVQSQHISFDSIAKLIPGENNRAFNRIVNNEHISILLYHPEKKDLQQPHNKDEYYFVVKGTGEFFYKGKLTPFKTGDVLFAAAGEEHRFENFSDDLFVWVIFYGPSKK